MKSTFFLLLAILLGAVSFPTTIGRACSRAYPFRLSELFSADLIVRATAVRYVIAPEPNTMTTGVPESTVEFKIEETVWGLGAPETIVLNGYLTDRDDFNDVPLPYRFVRRGGRGGSCFANSYKKDAQFLLFLKKGWSGYTTNFSALGPTNEQVRGVNDPWVKWVKAYLSPCARQGVEGADYASSSKAEMESMINKQTRDVEKYRIAKCYLVKYGADGVEAQRYLQVVNLYETIPERK